jgi:hypothetical protein
VRVRKKKERKENKTVEHCSLASELGCLLVLSRLAVAYKEVSLTTLPQPFVNPADAFSQLKPPGRGES